MNDNQTVSAANAAPLQEEPGILDTLLKVYWGYVRPFWWLYLCGALVALLGAVVFLLTATPRYSSSCRLHVSRNETRVVNINGIDDPGMGGGMGAAAVFMNTQIQLMGGDEMLAQAYRSLGLDEDQLLLLSKPKIAQVRDTSLVDVSVGSSDRELAARVANSIANTYIESLRSRRSRISSSGSELLRDQLNDVGKSYDKAVQSLLDYKRENGISDLELNYQQLQKQTQALQDRIQETENQAAELQLSLNEINANKDLAAVILPYLLSGDSVSNGDRHGGSQPIGVNNLFSLQTMLLQHEMKLPELMARYGEANQSVQVHRKVTEMIKAASRHEVEICIKGLQMRRERILKSKDLLEKQLATLNERIAALDRLRGDYKRREAAVDSLGKSVEMLTARMNEIQINEAVNKLDDYAVFVVNAAIPARSPYFPVPLQILTLALAAGLALAGGTSYLLAGLNNRIDDVRNVAALFGAQMPVFGNIPHFTADELRESIDKGENVVDEVFRNIRTSLNLSLATRNNKVIAITSGLENAGKTTISCFLARSFAREGKRVLLIDMDLRKAGVSRMLHDELPEQCRKRGVSNVLVGDCRLEEVACHLDKHGFDLAAVGPIPPNPGELLSQPSLMKMLDEASAKYDQILIDTSPLLMVSDALMVAGHGIPFVVVVNLSRMTRPLAQSLCERLRQVNLLPAGFLGNNVEMPRKGYGYGCKYGNGYGYGYGCGSYPADREKAHDAGSDH